LGKHVIAEIAHCIVFVLQNREGGDLGSIVERRWRKVCSYTKGFANFKTAVQADSQLAYN
jgi:hypothetical protein